MAITWPSANYSVNAHRLAGTPNSPAPTWGSGTAITLGMTNPYNGGSIAGDDFPSTNGTADPSYGETLWRVRATSPLANGMNNVLPSGNVSTNGWALFNISSPTAHDGAPQYSQGVELDTSTVGYSNVGFSFDWYSTTQGVRDMQFQYCLNTSAGTNAVWNSIGSGIGGAAGAVANTNSSWVNSGSGLTQIAEFQLDRPRRLTVGMARTTLSLKANLMFSWRLRTITTEAQIPRPSRSI